ncbi:unnamed protein product [Candidula unifasciata]|uniref:Transmembrane protein 141 n=1 Tax=Candidula unifasciata TaxID=100452 RepID=A0A8S3ZPJ0_9EUPU|nr:unnamed protein product [Candidula unifasciata]
MSRRRTQAEEELSQRYPHYDAYKLCQQRAFFFGSFTLLGVTASTYIIMNQWLQKYSPKLSKNWLVGGPLIAGAIASYAVTATKSADCKNMWLAMEERHSVITPAEERLAQRMKSGE